MTLDITPILSRVDVKNVIARTPAVAKYNKITDFIAKKQPEIISPPRKTSISAWSKIVKIFEKYGTLGTLDEKMYCIGIYVSKYLVCIDTPDVPPIPRIPGKIVLVDENTNAYIINLRKVPDEDRRLTIGATRRIYINILSNLIKAFVLSMHE